MKVWVFSELHDAQAMEHSEGHEIEAFDVQDAVTEACDKLWSDNDGWEWMRDGCTLYSVDPTGTILKHEIGPPDFTPEFYVPDGEPV